MQIRVSRDLAGLAPYERARAGIGYVPQGHQVFPHLTVYENLLVVHERGGGRPDAAAIDEALDVFPALRRLLTRPAGLLSGGQAQHLRAAHGLTGSAVVRPRGPAAAVTTA